MGGVLAALRASGRSGLGQMALAAFFFSLMSLLVRVAGARLPSAQIVLARAVVSLVISAAMLRLAGLSPWGTRRGVLLLRGLFGFGGLTCFFWSLLHLPLAEATVIQYMNPVFTALLAALVLREPLRARTMASVAISLLGVVLVARPRMLFEAGAAPAPEPAVVAVALLGSIFSAAAYVTVRRATGTEHPLVVVFWFPAVATPLAVLPAAATWVPPTPGEGLVLLGVGVATHLAQVCMTRGLLLEPAGRATAMTYLQVVFAAAWGALLLSELPPASTWLGAALIGSSVLLLAARRRAAPALR